MIINRHVHERVVSTFKGYQAKTLDFKGSDKENMHEKIYFLRIKFLIKIANDEN